MKTVIAWVITTKLLFSYLALFLGFVSQIVWIVTKHNLILSVL